MKQIKLYLSNILWILFFLYLSYFVTNTYRDFGILIGSFTLFSVVMSLQGIFSILWMTHAWDDEKNLKSISAPKKFSKSKHSFTAVICALYEEDVIADTMKAVANIDYPEELKELLVVIPERDPGTIKVAKEAAKQIGKKNVKVLVDRNKPKSKPDQLNYSLTKAKNDILVIFDAEDEPSKDIYNVVNSRFIQTKADVIQAGVQLMNYRSNWFSTINVLEYYLWFKSGLNMFSKFGVVTLGGVTVFFKTDVLKKIGGWDASCLTEDGDIGIRLSKEGYKIDVTYDEKYVTKEECPLDVATFIKQRSRWHQGFLQILLKGEWLKLPTIKARALAFYVLFWHNVQALIFLVIPFSIYSIFALDVPDHIAVLVNLPTYLMLLNILNTCIALYMFTSKFSLKFYWWLPLKVLITYIPYTMLIGVSAIRSVIRSLRSNSNWEKTVHFNAHRINQVEAVISNSNLKTNAQT